MPTLEPPVLSVFPSKTCAHTQTQESLTQHVLYCTACHKYKEDEEDVDPNLSCAVSHDLLFLELES